MSMRLTILSVLICFSCSTLHAQLEDSPRRLFKDLSKMEGTWFMPTKRGDRLDSWKKENDSTMVGLRFRIRDTDGDTIILEHLTLELRDTNILYTSIARNQNNNEPVVYTLTRADYDGYLFETDMIENPQKINYLLLNNREIQINTQGVRGSRTVSDEFVYEREFSSSALEFRVRVGMNMYSLFGTGNFQKVDADPEFGPRLGWEVGTGVTFKGQGGYFAFNIEGMVSGQNSDVKSEFIAIEDTSFTQYIRDGNYGSVWLKAAFLPEFFPVREGRFSILAGPYIGTQLSLRAKGEISPAEDSDLFDTNNDLKNADFGVIAGLQYRFNIGEKDLGSLVGLRANLGISNLDNLYDRGCDNPSFCNGQVFFRGISLYYSMNLLNL